MKVLKRTYYVFLTLVEEEDSDKRICLSLLI